MHSTCLVASPMLHSKFLCNTASTADSKIPTIPLQCTALLVIKIVTSVRECVVSDRPKSFKLKILIMQVSSSKYTATEYGYLQPQDTPAPRMHYFHNLEC